MSHDYLLSDGPGGFIAELLVGVWLGHSLADLALVSLALLPVAVEDMWLRLGSCSSTQGSGRAVSVPSTLSLALSRKHCCPSHKYERIKSEF